MQKIGHIAIDLGASSGRVILGTLQNGQLKLKEIHRFMNEPVYVGERFYWNLLSLFNEIKKGLIKAANNKEIKITTIGIDTWGVDGAWIDKDGNLLTYPIHYRDNRTEAIMDNFYKNITDEELYTITGIQKMPFNTIYQLYWDVNKDKKVETYGDKWLFIPDLLGYLLTGNVYNEYTIASTGAVLDAETGEYSKTLFEELHLPLHKMQKIVKPGEIIGNLLPKIEKETGLKDVKVIAVGSHDTASAVAGTPLKQKDEAYLICGTWCLMGMERKRPCITKKARSYNFTNEGGVENTIRVLKNINGLWFMQELRRGWNKKGNDLSFPDIIEQVKQTSHKYAIDAADNRFLAPDNMEQEIIAYCSEKYNVQLNSIGEIAKAAYNGLTNLYVKVLDELQQITNQEVKKLRMVGGGVQDQYLCERVADATGITVIAGPIEASCIGNILMQMKGIGAIASLDEGREIVEKSFEQVCYLPKIKQ